MIFFFTLAKVIVKITLTSKLNMIMKKFYTILLAVCFSAGAMWAQNRSVTFQVDMSGVTVSANGVHVAGDFQQAAGASGNWQPGATQMTQVGTSNIYAATVSIPDGKYQFKFINDNDWPGVESVPGIAQVSLGMGFGSGNDNRFTAIASDTTLPAILFGGAAPAGMSNITMLVDMSTQATVEDTVSVAGDFQGWSPGVSLMNDFTGDSMYRHVAYVMAPDTLNFKYVNGTAWGQDESVPSACAVGGNRQLIAGGDTVFGPLCYAQCIACFIPDTFNVTLQVDMSATCGFDPTTDSVDIAGPFNGWSGGDMLTDPDGDMVYTITKRMLAPSFEYKARFIVGGSPNWESGNNRVVNFSGDTTVPVRCFGFETYGACAAKPDPSDITFEVDMSNTSATFTNVYLIGDFTDPSWQGGAVALTPTGTPGVFSTTITGICPGKIAFKYMIDDGSGNQIEEDFSAATDTSCLEPSGTGNYNRFYVRPDDQPKTISAPWEECANISVSEVAAAEFKVYPNPFKGSTTVELPAGVFNLKMIDVSGKVVSQVNNAETKVELNADGFTPGVYFLTVTNNSGYNQTQKLIIQ